MQRIFVGAADEADVVRGVVNARDAAQLSDSSKPISFRKSAGADSIAEGVVDFSQPPFAVLPLLGRIRSALPNRPNLEIDPSLQSPAAIQVLTTVAADAGVPPDANGAVGRTQVVTAVNGGLWITPRSARALSSYVGWLPFWRSVLPANRAVNAIFDPRLLYDATNSRYILTMAYYACDGNACLQDGSLLIGASATDDAAGAWQLFRIPLNDQNHYWVDFPRSGQNQHQVVISINSFKTLDAPSELENHKQLVMLDKTGLFGPGADLNLSVFNVDAFVYGPGFYPASTSDSSSSLPIISQSYSRDVFTFHRIHRLAPGSGSNGAALLDLGISSFTTAVADNSALPYRNPQLGTTSNAFCLGGAPVSVERNGQVWFTSSALFDQSDHSVSGLQWAQVVPETGVVVQNGVVSKAARDTALLCSSIAVNAAGDMLIGITQTSPQSYLSAGYFLRRQADAPGTVRQIRQYADGQSPLFSNTVNQDVTRIGDYSQSALDPLNPRDFWTVQERANAGNAAAISWAQVKTSGVDLQAQFATDCVPGSACPLLVRNVGSDAAAPKVSVRLALSAHGSSLGAQLLITLKSPPGWRCLSTVGSRLSCSKKDAFVPGESALFTYTHTSRIAATLYVTVESRDFDLQPESNRVQRELLPAR